jgi:hypothetical protein
VLVSSGRLAVTSYDLEKATPDFSSPTAMPTTFVLKNRPNIYFFFLESFHDREAINRLYGFDAPDFYSQLYKNNFTLYDAFATNLGTVQALLPLVTMRHHYSRITFGHSELSRKGRIFLTDNNVFRILKNNNYSINLFDNNNHVFRYDSPLVNYANFKRYTNSRLQYIIDAFVTMNKNLDALIPVLSLVFNKNFSHLDDIVLHSVSSVPDDFLNYYPSKFNIKQPGFYFIHFGAIHIPWEIGFYEATEYKKTFDEKYRNQYVQGTIDTLRILEYIIKNDPQSLIILMGDHGAFGNGLYREISKMNVTEANKFFRNHKIEPKDAARHLISVLLAVRWPNKYAPNYQPRDGFGDVNLFPFIFSVLSNIPYNDDNFSPNFSMCTPRGFIMAKYGNLLDDWEDFNENPDNPNKIYMHDK